LRSLQGNTDLTVLPAEKGNATVILNTVDYNQKMASFLDDPTETVEKKTALIKTSLPQDVAEQLRPHGSRPSRLYGLPKIHKDGIPLRPIVSTIGSPTYCLAKHLACLRDSHLDLTPHRVKNSEDFAQTLDTLRVGTKDILVSLDVISLFTRVPLNDALDLLTRHFD
jgi:hypothetical protein